MQQNNIHLFYLGLPHMQAQIQTRLAVNLVQYNDVALWHFHYGNILNLQMFEVWQVDECSRLYISEVIVM